MPPYMPLAEASRIPLHGAYVGDFNVWKADDAGETLIFAFKDTSISKDDQSFFALTKGATQLQYLGTTAIGKKDGRAQPIVYNDGTVVVVLSETPTVSGVGADASLWLVTLKYKLTGEPATPGTTDQTARNAVKRLATDIMNAVAASAKA